jgi:hypothetical protein
MQYRKRVMAAPETPVFVAPGFCPGAFRAGGLTPLRAAFGQDEANHGTEQYLVDQNGLIWVPLEAVAALTKVGGFAFVAPSRDNAPPAGPLRLHHDDAASCCYAGRQYAVDANGDVLVPAEAASELMAHGFAPVLGAANRSAKE